MTSFHNLGNGISSKKIAIIGGGPAGLLAAISFAKKGALVTIFEKRSQNEAASGNSRSFNLTLSSRGINALIQQGLWDEVKAITIPVSGRMCHSELHCQAFEYSSDSALVLHAVQRSAISKCLYTIAGRFKAINVKFNHSLEALDETNNAVVMTELHKGSTRSYGGFDLIIGADGAKSETRHLVHRSKAVNTTKSYLEWGYRELILPSSENTSMKQGYLHVWPCDEIMMFALPNANGSFGANLIFPLENENYIFKQDKLAKLIEEQFPDLSHLSESMATELMAKKTSYFFAQRSSLWHSDDKTVLIGDAAHAMVPFYGQGMNCAFEGVSQLISLLDDEWTDGSLPTILKKYQQTRIPHTDRIADLSERNFKELRSDFGKLGPQAERMAEVLFHRIAPNIFCPLHILISHGDLGYQDAELMYKRQRRSARWLGLGILKQVCAVWISACNHYRRFPYLTQYY